MRKTDILGPTGPALKVLVTLRTQERANRKNVDRKIINSNDHLSHSHVLVFYTHVLFPSGKLVNCILKAYYDKWYLKMNMSKMVANVFHLSTVKAD